MRRLLHPVTLLLALVAASAAAQPESLKPAGYVNDFAGILDDGLESELDRLLGDLEQKTGSEVAVATVTSLDGMSVEEFANRLFKAWGVGQAKADNGVLVLVAPSAREMRIEVGYGLEGVLPDGLAGQIIRESFIPRFRDNDYPGGIRAGVRRVVEVVERHQVLSAEEIARLNDEGSSGAPPWVVIPALGLFVALGSFLAGVGAGAKAAFPVIFGALFAGMPLAMGLALRFSAAVWTLPPLAVVLAVWGFRLGRRPEWQNSLRASMRGGGSGGGGSSGWSGRSSGGSSSSSFGGGRSGGGGSSGRW